MRWIYIFRLMYVVSAITVCTPLYAQQLSLKNTKLLGGKGHESMYDMLYDTRDKSIVFTGYTWDSCGTGDLPPCPPVTGHRDLFIGKVDSGGQLLWIRQYASKWDDVGTKLLITDSGYLVLGIAGFHDGDAANNSYDFDGWVLKLNFQGNVVWKKGYGSPNGSDEIFGGTRTYDGGYIFTGNSNGSGGDIPFQYVISPAAIDGFVIKTDSIGNVRWSRTLGGTKDDGFINVFEVNKEYYLTAWSISHDHECNDQSWYPSGLNTGADYYLIKLDSAGNYLWNRSYGGTGGERLEDAIFDERDSTFLMIGSTTSNDYMVQRQVTTGYNDVWLIKVDLSGNLKWAKVHGDSTIAAWSFGATIRPVDLDKGYVITYSAEPAPPPTPIPTGYYGRRDIKITIIDSMGNVHIDKVIGGTSFENDGICIGIGNKYILGGSTNSGQLSEGITSPARGGGDWFISYLDYYPLSVPEIADEKKTLLIYPNPTEGSVTVTTPNNTKGGIIKIVDAGGKTVLTQTMPPNKNQLEITTDRLPKGIYTVSLITGKQVITAKMILK